MEWIVKVPSEQFRLTVEFWQSRPLSRPDRDRTHPHGAWDIAPTGNAVDPYCREKLGAGVGIYAPEDGEVAFFAAIRNKPGEPMSTTSRRMPKDFFDMRNHYYFYDLYGGMIILRGKESGYTHIFTHCHLDSMFKYSAPYLEKEVGGRNENFFSNLKRNNKRPELRGLERFRIIEAGGTDNKFPIILYSNLEKPYSVKAGRLLSTIGNAGFSTGPHIHYEIHHGDHYEAHRKRVNPIDVYPEIWERHKDDHRRFYNYEDHMSRWKK